MLEKKSGEIYMHQENSFSVKYRIRKCLQGKKISVKKCVEIDSCDVMGQVDSNPLLVTVGYIIISNSTFMFSLDYDAWYF